MRVNRIYAVVPLTLLLIAVSFSSPGADVLSELKQKYQALDYLQATGRIVSVTEKAQQSEERLYPYELFWQKPNLLRFKVEEPNFGFELVSDGKTLWFYLRGLNRYVELEPPAQFTDQTMRTLNVRGAVSISFLNQLLFSEGFPQDMFGEQYQLKEIQGRTIKGRECKGYEVVAEQPPPGLEFYRFYVDEQLTPWRVETQFNLHEKRLRTFEEVEEHKLEPPQAGNFEFRPAPGAKKKENFAFLLRSDEEVEAPEFALQDTRGTTHTLAEARGKVLILGFVKPGSPPSILQLEHLQRVWERVGGQQLLIWAVFSRTLSPEATLPYTLPFLFDPGDKVFSLYKVSQTPSVVIIDAEGYIAYEFNREIDELTIFEVLREMGMLRAPAPPKEN